MSILEKVRRWIDGESAELVLEQAARDAQIKPRSRAEAFIVKIARAIEIVMQQEMVPLPTGTTIIPSEYLIFLSEADDKEWQGAKRKGLEQGLYHILAERAQEIAGKRKLETRFLVIELRIDGTLAKGDVRVQHTWEDETAGKTGVLRRPREVDLSRDAQTTGAANAAIDQLDSQGETGEHQISQTPDFIRQGAAIAQAEPISATESEVLTQVRPRGRELFRLEIFFNGVRQNVVPVFKHEISLGRGSRSTPVDIVLSGDAEISRRHMVISTDGKGNFWSKNEGRNPATINGRELPLGERVPLGAGVPIAVCSYTLRIQPQ